MPHLARSRSRAVLTSAVASAWRHHRLGGGWGGAVSAGSRALCEVSVGRGRRRRLVGAAEAAGVVRVVLWGVRERGGDRLADAVRDDVGGHVVGGDDEHAAAHLVHRRRLERVALAVLVPRDEVARAAADVVVVGGVAGRGALVVSDAAGGVVLRLLDGLAVPAVEHVPRRVDGRTIVHAVDDREDLALDADVGSRRVAREGPGGLGVGEAAHRRAAEDAVEEVVLVLPRRLAGAEGRVGPVELVREADVHVLAVLPVVLFDRAVRVADRGVAALPELLALVAHVADAHAAVGGREAAVRARVRVLVRVVEGRVLVVLARAFVLGADVPVHVDGAHALVVVVHDGREGGVAVARGALRHVGGRLRAGGGGLAVNVAEVSAQRRLAGRVDARVVAEAARARQEGRHVRVRRRGGGVVVRRLLRHVAAARRDDAEHDAREHGVDDAEQVGAGHQALAGAGGLGAAELVLLGSFAHLY